MTGNPDVPAPSIPASSGVEETQIHVDPDTGAQVITPGRDEPGGFPADPAQPSTNIVFPDPTDDPKEDTTSVIFVKPDPVDASQTGNEGGLDGGDAQTGDGGSE